MTAARSKARPAAAARRKARVAAPTPIVGRSVLRKEDPALLRGAARFVDDLRGGALEIAILRSPFPHARIAAIDVAEARRQPGVVDVLVAADLPDGGPVIPMRMFRQPGAERFLQRPLATDRVRYVGEPVAVVVATSRYLAEDAAERIAVDYEPLDPVTDMEAALAPDAPVLHAEAGTNLAAAFDLGRGDVDAAFAAADAVVEVEIRCGRHAAVPMETRGLLARLEPGGGRLVVHGAAKVVHVNRRILAGLLGWPEDRIRFVEESVGGGFGARGEFYPEDYLVPFCALRLGQAVAWTEDREEHLRATNHSRDQLDRLAAALTADGRFLALRAELTINTGAYVRTHGSVVPGMSGGLLPGPYVWPALACHVRQVVTNKTPAGTYRAPGRYETTLARERLIDVAARRLGIDPVELRRRNLVAPEQMPYDNGSATDGHPVVYDSGDYPRLLERGLEHVVWEELRAWRATPPQRPELRRGVAIALFVEKSGIAQWEYARMELDSLGRPVLCSGSASVGQGVDTVLAQIAAEALGVPYEAVRVRHGDTDDVPDGMGAFGSRATSLGGAAAHQAASALRERVLELAAAKLDVAVEKLELTATGVSVRGARAAGVTFAELVAASGTAAAIADGRRPGLSEEAYFRTEEMSFPYGLHCAAVELDAETGAVRIERYGVAYDVGRAINPQLVEGQIVGGLAQGLGGALFEDLVYDDAAQLVSGSFMDYLIPTAVEVPAVRVLITEDCPTQRSPIGAKGAGEGGTTAAGAALAGAVSDALGVEVTRLPMTPEWIVRAARGEACA
ncbi:MAG: xanthine dehydrogenase family protein molybdopterin-binding subunit [Conexibacter sp.]